ncbi:MAG: hypothetical protein A2Y93_00780 [Chloroflexi bacterium RBG_13_68_17]|jgi:signal transduction histidine kinase|nr:MAG: hypothetical protein A2Y93_00780 [Chloroflexi bacterium RBG_13_68_17]
MRMAKQTILVVEDNLALLEGIRDLLEVSGYNALIAENAEEALKLLADNRPDLIVSDIMMPGMDGYQFYEEVRKRPELIEVPFIFLTARGEKRDIRKGKELGADDYITKPFEEEDLLVVVRAKLARRQAIERQMDARFSDLKRTILNTLSHEFRTPLTYVLNYSELLETEADEVSPEEFHTFMQGIRRGAERLNRLVMDFIALIELETGEAETVYQLRRRRLSDVGPWLRVVGRGFEDAARARNLALVLEVPDSLPDLMADEAFLADAIGRLLENAIKFSGPMSQWIRLAASVEAGQLRIAVSDQGVGIRREDLDSLFNLFHQIDRPKHEQQGAGSGLAICKGMVELHGGRVSADSQVGVGSTFIIELPAAPDEMPS